MLPTSICHDSVTVKRARLIERRGSMVPDWTNPEESTVSGCSFQRRTTAQDRNGRVLQVTNGAVLYAPPDADIRAGDRIEFGGATYEVDGAPMPQPGATGALSHLEITLTNWSG